MQLSKPEQIGLITRLGNQSYFFMMKADIIRKQIEALQQEAMKLDMRVWQLRNERMRLLRSLTPVKIIPIKRPRKPPVKKVQTALEIFSKGITDKALLAQIEKLKGVL